MLPKDVLIIRGAVPELHISQVEEELVFRDADKAAGRVSRALQVQRHRREGRSPYLQS